MTSARDFAAKAHLGQQYGTKSYFSHLQAVVEVLSDFGYKDDWAAAGWLHDTLKDTNTTREQLYHLFGNNVLRLVDACTGIGVSRKSRNQMIYRKIGLCPEAAIVKVADRIANVEACSPHSAKLMMYKSEREEFFTHVASKAPFKMQDRLNKSMDLLLSVARV